MDPQNQSGPLSKATKQGQANSKPNPVATSNPIISTTPRNPFITSRWGKWSLKGLLATALVSFLATMTEIPNNVMSWFLNWRSLTLEDRSSHNGATSIEPMSLKGNPRTTTRFSMTVEQARLLFGSVSAVVSRSMLARGKVIPIRMAGVAPVMYVEGTDLFVDIDLFSPLKGEPIRFRRNALENAPPDWEMVATETAMEVVNGQGEIVFQLVYRTGNHIQMTGRFYSSGGLVIADDTGIYVNPIQDRMLKAIFKHPSWKYGVQFAE